VSTTVNSNNISALDWNDNSAAIFEAKLKVAIGGTAAKIHLFEKLGFLPF
jgi:hypothetical protein